MSRVPFNLDEIRDDLDNVCLTEAVCKKCLGKKCLIGYSKYCVAECKSEDQGYLEDGIDGIPTDDLRDGYDEFDSLHAIAHLLNQCHSCKNDHNKNCILNIVRNAYEVIEFGEEQDYEGNPLSYMMKLNQINPEKAAIILDEYNAKK